MWICSFNIWMILFFSRSLNTIQIVYFYVSFGYLLLRTIAMALYAASIYDESRVAKEVLYAVPAHSYQVEVRYSTHFRVSVTNLRQRQRVWRLSVFRNLPRYCLMEVNDVSEVSAASIINSNMKAASTSETPSKLLAYYTAAQPRRHQSSYSPPKILHKMLIWKTRT